MDQLDKKLIGVFEGRVVRKDLLHEPNAHIDPGQLEEFTRLGNGAWEGPMSERSERPLSIWPTIEGTHRSGHSTCIYFNREMFTFFCRVYELKEYDGAGFELWWAHPTHESFYCAGVVATGGGSCGKELVL